MKRTLRLLTGVCGALLLATLAAPAASRTLADIRNSGELRLCVAGSSAAFYQANGEAFARYLDVRPQVVRLENWDQQFHDAAGVTVKEARYEAQLLASGRCDLYPNDLHMVDWRRTKMRLVPYYTTRKVIVAHRDLRQVLKGPADLAGRRAAVQKGTAYETWLNQENETSFRDNPVRIELLPTAESMKLVAEAQVDFTVIGAEGAFKWVRGELENLDLLFAVDELVEVGWGVSPAANDLAAALERFFADSLRVGSDLDRAWQKQYAISRMEFRLLEASFDEKGARLKDILVWAAPVGSGLLGVILAMSFWARRLRREIADHRQTEQTLRLAQETAAQEAARRLAVTEILLDLQQAGSLESFGRTLLSDLARRLPVTQGIFCLHHAPTETLQAVAHYAGAGASPAESLAQVQAAGSLLDRCLATRQPILVEQCGEHSLRIRSGLGQGEAAALLIQPIRQADQVLALLELATLQAFAPHHRQLIEDLEPIVALLLERFLEKEAPA